MWNKLSRKKPKPNQRVLIFREGVGAVGNKWEHIDIAFYTRHPSDKRQMCFANQIEDHSAWVYDSVTYWQELPERP